MEKVIETLKDTLCKKFPFLPEPVSLKYSRFRTFTRSTRQFIILISITIDKIFCTTFAGRTTWIACFRTRRRRP